MSVAGPPHRWQTASSLSTNSATQSSVGIEPNGSPRKSCARPAATTRAPRFDEGRDRFDDPVVEELHLVDPDRVVTAREPKHLGTRRCSDRPHLRPGVRDDMPDVVAVVDERLDDQRPLPRDLRAAQPADELLALPGEHRPAHDLEPSTSLRLETNHGRDPNDPHPTARCSLPEGGGAGLAGAPARAGRCSTTCRCTISACGPPEARGAGEIPSPTPRAARCRRGGPWGRTGGAPPRSTAATRRRRWWACGRSRGACRGGWPTRGRASRSARASGREPRSRGPCLRG